MANNFCNYFSSLTDPRINRKKLYSLDSILFITFCAILSGCNHWDEIEEYGINKQEWLSKFVDLPNGIPSHDTINRVFSLLNPLELQRCFIEWIQSIIVKSKQNIINIDGKRLCNSGTKGLKTFVHLVNAWSNDNQLILGQIKTEDKSNEITAIPTLLDLFEIKGAKITIDAIGCQRAIVNKIAEGEGGYMIAVKENQETLLDDIKEAFENTPKTESATSKELGHGRIESRTCKVIKDMGWISQREKWESLKSIVCIESKRIDKLTGKEQAEKRYYISNLEETPEGFNYLSRSHWGVENSLHWSMDVVFREDYSTKGNGNAAENFSMISKAALSILKNDTNKGGLKTKRLKCGWSNKYLEDLLSRGI